MEIIFKYFMENISIDIDMLPLQKKKQDSLIPRYIR